jgi:phosphatidylglycerol:prolipoprotein diacylglycerol transferase
MLGEMIPFFRVHPIPVFGNLTLQPFGLLVGTGVLVGAWFAKRRAHQDGIPEKEIQDAIFWAVVPGFLMAHWWTVFLYHPEWLDERGWSVVFKFWEGLSSFGGFFGAALGMFLYFRHLHKPWLKHAEIIIQALVVGWVFGRLGCTIVHDHPGQHTDFFLAVQYPDGPRFDLGLYEFLYTLLVLLPVSLWLHSRKLVTGSILAAMILLYAPMRFTFDFLRLDDRPDADMRYLGLTPAQYGCIVAFAFAVWLLMRLRRVGAGTTSAGQVAPKKV